MQGDGRRLELDLQASVLPGQRAGDLSHSLEIRCRHAVLPAVDAAPHRTMLGRRRQAQGCQQGIQLSQRPA